MDTRLLMGEFQTHSDSEDLELVCRNSPDGKLLHDDPKERKMTTDSGGGHGEALKGTFKKLLHRGSKAEPNAPAATGYDTFVCCCLLLFVVCLFVCLYLFVVCCWLLFVIATSIVFLK
jgi:hypothetical protein